MRGSRWLEAFLKTLDEMEDELDYSSPGKWTESIGRVMDVIGEKFKNGVSRRRPFSDEEEGEFLGIDFMFFCRNDSDEGSLVLPEVIVEHHNEYPKEDIAYCLWKLLCVRSPVRVLICYQSKTNNIDDLKKYLEEIIWEGNLMKGTDSDLLVIIGDESIFQDSDWLEYYNIFEWRNDKLKRIKRSEQVGDGQRRSARLGEDEGKTI